MMQWLVDRLMDLGVCVFVWGHDWHERHNTLPYRRLRRAVDETDDWQLSFPEEDRGPAALDPAFKVWLN